MWTAAQRPCSSFLSVTSARAGVSGCRARVAADAARDTQGAARRRSRPEHVLLRCAELATQSPSAPFSVDSAAALHRRAVVAAASKVRSTRRRGLSWRSNHHAGCGMAPLALLTPCWSPLHLRPPDASAARSQNLQCRRTFSSAWQHLPTRLTSWLAKVTTVGEYESEVCVGMCRVKWVLCHR